MPTTSRSSPTTTRAVKEKRRPPLTTFATRLIWTTRSCRSRPSRSLGMRPIGCLSELQSARTGAVGERLYAPVIEVAAAIEHDALDTGLERPARDLATDSGGKVGLRTGHAVKGLGRRRDERAARVVVDDLGVDPAIRPVHGESRARGRTRHASTDSTVTA